MKTIALYAAAAFLSLLVLPVILVFMLVIEIMVRDDKLQPHSESH